MGITQRIHARLAPELWETEHRLYHAIGRVRAPVAVQWMVTRSCDLHCEHCYAEAGKRAHAELSTQEGKSLVIDAAADLGCSLMVFAGGELWLRRDIEELIAHAVARGMEWAMHTHGGHIPKHAEFLRRHPPSLAAISLDGDRRVHDEFRGKHGSYEAAMAAVGILREAGCREVVLGTTVTRHNADQMVQLFPAVKRSGAHSWGLHLVAPEGRAQLDLLPRPDQLRRLAEFARRRRAVFPVELCNEWGSAGADDPYYRDRPFACGAGRISMVVDPCGNVMPCTTLDESESEGNLRDLPMKTLWVQGFEGFRGGGDPGRSDGHECWLQTRNGVKIAEAAFGESGRRQPKLIDYVPQRLYSLTRRALQPRRGVESGIASKTTRRAVAAAAMGIAFVSSCTIRSENPKDPSKDDPVSHSSSTGDAAPPPDLPQLSVQSSWPATLDDAGMPTYAAWTDFEGPWRHTTIWALIEWERGSPAPALALATANDEAGQRAIEDFGAELARHVERGFGQSSVVNLVALLDAAERASLFDAAFAAHIWRSAEHILPVAASSAAPDMKALELRATLYARLARHQRVVQVLVAVGATLGPITQRPWLKKSAPPANWRDIHIPQGYAEAAQSSFEAGVEGPWQQVGCSISVDTQRQPILYRDGTAIDLAELHAPRWTRLDVLYFPSAAQVTVGGIATIEVPAGSVLCLGGLESLVDETTGATLDALIGRASQDEQQALAELEQVLPIAARRLRAFVEGAGEGEVGALLTVLVAFEE